jgi:hypothetical protein
MSTIDTVSEQGVPAGLREARSPWQAVGVLAIAVFLSVLDLFIVNIAYIDIHPSRSRSQTRRSRISVGASLTRASPHRVSGIGWERGVPLDYLDGLVGDWRGGSIGAPVSAGSPPFHSS